MVRWKTFVRLGHMHNEVDTTVHHRTVAARFGMYFRIRRKEHAVTRCGLDESNPSLRKRRH